MRYILLVSLVLMTACQKRIEPERMIETNSTIVYSLDRNYTVVFPTSRRLSDTESVVKNKEMIDLLKNVKVLILKNKKRDVIIDALSDKENMCN